MISRELMLNDWIEVISNDHLKYVQIKEIYQSSILTKEFEYESEEIRIDNIKPIPLTPEILEKNGFEETKNYYPYPTYEYHIKDKDKKFVVRVAFPNCSKATKRTKPFIEIDAEWCWYNNDCEFVHQLQNALKLCGIDKTIEL